MIGGISLGVALSTSVAMVSRLITSSLEQSVSAIAGETDLIVTSGELGFPESTLERVQRVAGVSNAVPSVENRVYYSAQAGSTETLMLLGIDLLNDRSVRSYDANGAAIVKDPLLFMSQPDSIAITRPFATAHGLATGARLPLITALGRKEFVVRALIDATGPAKAFGGALAVMDIEAARLAFGKEGKVDRIDIRVAQREDLAGTARRLRDSLGTNFTVEPASAQAEQLRRTVKSFRMMLGFFGSMALGVAFLLVAGSATAVAWERRPEVGVLRALGATRESILFLHLMDAALLGAVASAIGLGLGIQSAHLLARAAQASLLHQYGTPLGLVEFQFGLPQILLAIATGTLVSLLANFKGAWTSMSVHPIEATGRGAPMAPPPPPSAMINSMGYLCLVALPVSSLLGLAQKFPATAAIAPALSIVGAVWTGPGLALLLVRALRWPADRFSSVLGRLALDQVLSDRRRSTGCLRGFLVGLVMVVILSAVNSSFRDAVTQRFRRSARPDLNVSANGKLSSLQLQPVSEGLKSELETVPGVRGAYGQRVVRVPFVGKAGEPPQLISLRALDEVPVAQFAKPYAYLDVVDRPVEEAGRDLYHSETLTVLASESFEAVFKLKTGDRIALGSPSGPVEAKIVGIVSDFIAGGGSVYMDRLAYRRIWKDPLVTGFGLLVAAGSDPLQVKAEIDRRFGKSHGLMVTSDAELKVEMEQAVDNSFVYMKAIQIVVLSVALLGFLNSLLVSVGSRFKEIGTIRALGMSRSELTTTILLEAAALGTSASLVAIVLGGAIAWYFVREDLGPGFGWVVGFHVDAVSGLLTLGGGLIVAILAGLLPARWAASLPIREALRSE